MTTSSPTDFSTTTIPWQGFDHVAIITHDLDATIHFYIIKFLPTEFQNLP